MKVERTGGPGSVGWRGWGARGWGARGCGAGSWGAGGWGEGDDWEAWDSLEVLPGGGGGGVGMGEEKAAWLGEGRWLRSTWSGGM